VIRALTVSIARPNPAAIDQCFDHLLVNLDENAHAPSAVPRAVPA
jgi:hypothetical protein